MTRLTFSVSTDLHIEISSLEQTLNILSQCLSLLESIWVTFCKRILTDFKIFSPQESVAESLGHWT